MKVLVLLFKLLVSCNNNIQNDYNSTIVDDYTEHFTTLDSIEQEEEKLFYILDSFEVAKNDNIYKE